MLAVETISALACLAMNTQDAIDAFGSPLRLADALGITRAAIYQWGETVPPLREYQIRELLAEQALDVAASSAPTEAA